MSTMIILKMKLSQACAKNLQFIYDFMYCAFAIGEPWRANENGLPTVQTDLILATYFLFCAVLLKKR